MVRFRSIKGKDLDGLRDRRRMASGESINDLLNNCTLSVVDRSIYGTLKDFDWMEAVLGDRMHALIGLREATSGPMYGFDIRCADADCKYMIRWQLNLNQLPRKPLPEESKEVFLNGNSFETAVGEQKVVFKLQTGRDQIRLSKLVSQIKSKTNDRNREQEQNRKVLLGVANRVTSVEGCDNIMGWLADLDLADISELVKNMDAVDCGVETGIEIECSSCGLRQEIDLPLDKTFFDLAI